MQYVAQNISVLHSINLEIVFHVQKDKIAISISNEALTSFKTCEERKNLYKFGCVIFILIKSMLLTH